MLGIFHKLINLEINLLYRLARAMDIILRDCEKNLSIVQDRFHREKKKAFNELIKSIENSKRLYDKLDDDVCSIFTQGEYFDLVQEEAFELARILVLFADRHGKDSKVGKNLESILRAKEGSGCIPPPTPNYDYIDRNFKLKV